MSTNLTLSGELLVGFFFSENILMAHFLNQFESFSKEFSKDRSDDEIISMTGM